MTARALGWLGLALAASGAVGWLISPLDMPDASGELVSHVAEHRTEILLYAYLGVLGTAAQLVFFVGLRDVAGDAERVRFWGRLGLLAMLVEVAVVSTAFALFAVLAHLEPGPDVAAALRDSAWLFIDLAAGPVTSVGLMGLAIALVRSGVVDRWLLPLTAVVAVAHLLVAAAFAREGFLSPDGGIAIIVPLLFFSWFAAVGAPLAAGGHAPGASSGP